MKGEGREEARENRRRRKRKESKGDIKNDQKKMKLPRPSKKRHWGPKGENSWLKIEMGTEEEKAFAK